VIAFRGRARADSTGFTLVEVLVALVVLEVGFLSAMGVLVSAQRSLASAERLHRATQDAKQLGDSLVRDGAWESGERPTEWGALRWSPGELVASDADGALLFRWTVPRGGAGL